MTNKTKRIIALVMMILGLALLIWMAVERLVYGRHYDVVQYIIAPLQIAFFGVMYRNFDQAVKEDEKYGNND